MVLLPAATRTPARPQTAHYLVLTQLKEGAWTQPQGAGLGLPAMLAAPLRQRAPRAPRERAE